MATNLAIGNIVQVNFYHTLSTQVAQVVRHYRISAIGGTPITDSDLADDLESAWAPLIKPAMSNVATWYGVKAQILTVPLPSSVTDFTNTGVGTSAAQPLAPQVAGLIRLKTGLAGRKNRGRSYIPFPSTLFQGTNGLPTTAYLTVIGAIANMLSSNRVIVVGARSGTAVPVIYHRATGGSTDIINATAFNGFATQRRRSLVNRSDNLPF